MNSDYFLLLVSLSCYVIFFKAIHHAWEKGGKKIMESNNKVAGISRTSHLQITGIILLGLPVTIKLTGQTEFLSFPKDPDHYLILIAVFLSFFLFVVLWIFATQKNKQHSVFSYPLNISPGAAVSYFLFRSIFLVTYEFFFRGILLFNLAIIAGIILSISVNIFLYVILHLFDNRQTIIGAIPFGIVLCWLSWETQSVWPAVIIHLIVALTYEIKTFCHFFQSPKKIIT